MYDEVRKTALGKGDDYSAGCLLDFLYYKDHFKLIFCDLSKQAVLDSILIDGRSLYDQNTMYDEVRKTALGKGDDYSAGCLLDFLYYKDHFKLIFCDLSIFCDLGVV